MTTDIIMHHKDITETADIGETTDIITETIIRIIMITECLIITRTIITPEEKYMLKEDPDRTERLRQDLIMVSEAV